MKKIKDIKLQFGDQVRTLRKERGLSQEALAFESELDRTYVGAVERGERNISLENINKLSKALSISISELLRGIGE